jgi:HD-GYP domain-containing protein (c-di-GMP phosphodiesterase class II)
MAQVLLIEDNKNFKELISLNLTTYVGVEVIQKSNAIDAIDLLRILPTIDLIITKSHIASEQTAQNLTDYLVKHNIDMSMIVIGELPAAAQTFGVAIESHKEWEKVIQLASKLLGITPKVLEKKVLPDYIPVPIHYFYPLPFCCCDVFIRIRKTPDEFQFVKRVHTGDIFSKEMVRRYEEQGLKSFYIPRDMQKNFTNFVSDQLVSKLEDDKLEIDEQIELLRQSHNIAIREIHKLGFTSATIQLTDSIVKSMIDSFKKNPEMSSLLHKIINSESSYHYQHSHMTSVVASECLKNLGLDEARNHQIIAYAAFLKDISLIDKPELAKISTFEELENSNLNEEDWDLVFNHAFEASVLVQKNPEAPIGVDEVMRCHHGSFNGKGFSVQCQKLSNLAQVFVVASEFVKELLLFKEEGGKPRPIIDELYKRFTSPEMTLITRALESTLKKRARQRTGPNDEESLLSKTKI